MNTIKNNFKFSLVLKNVSDDTLSLEDSLFEAGCDDALINFRNGAVYLDFDREATSFDQAVMSAIKDVESSSIKAIVASVAPENLVTESEIAARLDTNRQTVSLWIKGQRRSEHRFPKPIMKLSEKSPLWKWREVITWLFKNNLIDDSNLVAHAKFLEDLNAALEEREIDSLEIRHHLISKLGKLPPHQNYN